MPHSGSYPVVDTSSTLTTRWSATYEPGGYLQRFPNAEKLQDTLGEMIAEALTKEFKAQETWPPALS